MSVDAKEEDRENHGITALESGEDAAFPHQYVSLNSESSGVL